MVVKILAEALVQYGMSVSIITSNALTARFWYDPIFGKKVKRPYEVINGVTVFRLSTFQLLSGIVFIVSRFFHILPRTIRNRLDVIANGPYLLGLHNVLKRNSYDVIHSSPFPLRINKQVAACLANLSNKPLFAITPFFHAQVPAFSNPQLQQIFDKANIVHVISASEKNDIEQAFRVGSGKIRIIPLCIDTAQMYSSKHLEEDVRTLKKSLGVHNKKIILFAGIKGNGKGALDVLRAVYELWQEDSSYILVAIGTSTPQWESYKKTVDTRCFLDIPYKTGREKETYFAMCDMYCMPSATETFGLTYIESWHKVKPVIGADFPAVRELVKKNSGGLLVPYGNIEAIKTTITSLAQNPVLSKTLGQNGYNALMKKYTLTVVLPKYLALFGGVYK